MLDIVDWVGFVWEGLDFGENGKVVLKLFVVCFGSYNNEMDV